VQVHLRTRSLKSPSVLDMRGLMCRMPNIASVAGVIYMQAE
jgi:hypothetical protein